MDYAEVLKGGGVGVMPTDTIYGIVALANSERAVSRVYALKGRSSLKPCIILISSVEDLTQFGITLTPSREKVLMQYWPGPVSIIMPCGASVPEYLHRGTHTLAFRLPKNVNLQSFLKASGPLIAPSANPEGLTPATTIDEAKNYFGDEVDFYIDGGARVAKPSAVLSLDEQSAVTIIRA